MKEIFQECPICGMNQIDERTGFFSKYAKCESCEAK